MRSPVGIFLPPKMPLNRPFGGRAGGWGPLALEPGRPLRASLLRGERATELRPQREALPVLSRNGLAEGLHGDCRRRRLLWADSRPQERRQGEGRAPGVSGAQGAWMASGRRRGLQAGCGERTRI